MAETSTSQIQNENKPSFWPQLLSACTAGMASAMQGAVYALPTRAIPFLTQEEDPDMRLSPQAASWFVAMYTVAAICISPLGGMLSNIIGRRKCFIILTIISIIGYITMALSPNFPALFVGRSLTIVSASGMSAIIGVQISETVHSSSRGSLSVFQSLFNCIGMLVVLGLGYCVSDWRSLAWICMVPGCIHFIMIFFMHETPYWLVEKNMILEASKALQFYRGSSYDITEELNEILQRKEEKCLEIKDRNGCCSNLQRILSPAFGQPFFIVGVIFILNSWGEYTNLVMNMIQIFKESKSSIEPELAPVFVGIVQVLSALASSFILRRASTKILFVTCYAVVVVADISLATFSYLKNNLEAADNSFLDNLGWLPVVFVISIVSAQSIGVYPVLQLLMGELFPSDIRSLATGLTLSATFSNLTASILVYPFMMESFHFYGTFYFYAAIGVVAMLWGVFKIPDNRGLSLAKVEAKFSSMSLGKKEPENAK